jgi:hypothetical protein
MPSFPGVRAITALTPVLRAEGIRTPRFFANRFSTKSKPKAKIIRVNWQQSARYALDWKGRIQDASVSTI